MKYPQTIDEVIDHLDQIIENAKLNNKRHGYFPALYRQVTLLVKQKIEEGHFDDNQRMEQLDIVFANRYLEAYYNFEERKETTDCWRLSFQSCDKWSPLVLQHLLLGMNAHISLDLGLAAAEVSKDGNLEDLHDDFMRINALLASLVNRVQDQLAGMWPLLKPIDWLAGKLDESIASFGMDIARDAAWQVALDYSKIKYQKEKETYIRNRDQKVTTFGSRLAKPGIILNMALRSIRMLEFGSVRRKIQLLS